MIFLSVDPAEIAKRLAVRRHHFFPGQLAASQFGILEPPQPDERAVTVLPEKKDLAATVTTIVGMVAASAPGGEHEAKA